jgi:hypothetical protein
MKNQFGCHSPTIIFYYTHSHTHTHTHNPHDLPKILPGHMEFSDHVKDLLHTQTRARTHKHYLDAASEKPVACMSVQDESPLQSPALLTYALTDGIYVYTLSYGRVVPDNILYVKIQTGFSTVQLRKKNALYYYYYYYYTCTDLFINTRVCVRVRVQGHAKVTGSMKE